jgi:hypothetical protein
MTNRVNNNERNNEGKNKKTHCEKAKNQRRKKQMTNCASGEIPTARKADD